MASMQVLVSKPTMNYITYADLELKDFPHLILHLIEKKISCENVPNSITLHYAKLDRVTFFKWRIHIIKTSV